MEVLIFDQIIQSKIKKITDDLLKTTIIFCQTKWNRPSAPSALFWLICPFYIWHLRRETKSTTRKFSNLSIVKVLFAGILCCFAILDAVNWALNGNDQNVIDWLEPLAKFINPILVIILIKVRNIPLQSNYI